MSASEPNGSKPANDSDTSQADEGPIPSPEAFSDDLAAQAAHIAALQNELREMKDRFLRAAAEAENVRKRAEKDRIEGVQYASQKFAQDLLSVADNFRRALESVTPEARQDLPASAVSVLQGIEAIEREMLAIFHRHGVHRVEPKGQKFDPHYHQAIAEATHAQIQAGSVIEVMQPGYTLHGRLLRAAMVVVSKGPAASPEAPVERPNGGPKPRLDTKA